MPDRYRRAHKDDVARLRAIYACTVVAIVAMGLAVRYPGLEIPWPLAKYGGSILWGAMVCFLVATAAPKASVWRRAGIAAGISVLVELVRLYHTPWLDEFRLTTAGALLLGRIFSVWDIVAYWAGITAGAVAEKGLRRRWS